MTVGVLVLVGGGVGGSKQLCLPCKFSGVWGGVVCFGCPLEHRSTPPSDGGEREYCPSLHEAAAVDSGSGIASKTSNLERWLGGVFLVGAEREARYLCSAPPDSTPIPLAAVVDSQQQQKHAGTLFFFGAFLLVQGISP